MKYLVANHKSSQNYQDALDYIKELSSYQKLPNPKLLIAPTNLYLLKYQESGFTICAQDVSCYNNPSITGELTAKQLKSINCNYVIIGHYERYHFLNEDDQKIIAKLQNALQENLHVILCIGEDLACYESNNTKEYLYEKLKKLFASLPNDKLSNIILAYEPIYNIDTGHELDITHIVTTINYLKNIIKDCYGLEIKILYGGSISEKNILALIKYSVIDGYLIGKSSLSAPTIKEIVKIIVNN